jgi:hypothetical protein
MQVYSQQDLVASWRIRRPGGALVCIRVDYCLCILHFGQTRELTCRRLLSRVSQDVPGPQLSFRSLDLDCWINRFRPRALQLAPNAVGATPLSDAHYPKFNLEESATQI